MEIDFAHETRLFLGLYERELNSWLRQFCKAGSSCLDVGAAMGYDSLVMARLGASRIIAFECEPEAAEAAQRNLDSNPDLATSFTLVRAFVADRSEGARIAIDDYLEGQPGFAPDLVKIDIEGAELMALEGMSDVLQHHRPHLIIETHDRHIEGECSALLESHDYEPKIVNPRKWLSDSRPIEHNRWLVARGAASSRPARARGGSGRPPE